MTTMRRLPIRVADPFATIEGLSASLQRRDISSVELVTYLLDRISELDDQLHAFVELHPDEAIVSAGKADACRRTGLVRRLHDRDRDAGRFADLVAARG